jgi:hypothetical protein
VLTFTVSPGVNAEAKTKGIIRRVKSKKFRMLRNVG